MSFLRLKTLYLPDCFEEMKKLSYYVSVLMLSSNNFYVFSFYFILFEDKLQLHFTFELNYC